MRRIHILLTLAVLCINVCKAQTAPGLLPIGGTLPEFSLPGTDGATHKSSDWKASKALAVVFLCNHCTQSQVYEARLNNLAQGYAAKGVSVVAIQSSNPKAFADTDLAWSDVGESLADMKERATYRKFRFPYLYDGDTGRTAKAFGVTVAPTIFIFDRDRKLRYEGSIDSDPANGTATVRRAAIALDELLADKPVTTATTNASGCDLRLGAADVQASSSDTQRVDVTLATTTALTALRQNPTGKLLLVNFYATWCGPCVTEFPDLMATNRMYRRRPFSFTTVSSNVPAEKTEVLAFLQKMHATTHNLLYGSDDTYAMQEAFDANTGSAVPVTVLLSPAGQVLVDQQGEIDLMEIRRAILANLPDEPDHKGAQAYWAGK